jgi:D-hydantoinase
VIVDAVIKNCKIVSPQDIKNEGIAIHHGKIVAIGRDSVLPKAEKVIDAKGNYVIPGVIDTHAHYGVYHPYTEEIHDMSAAAFGGTTTLGCFCGLGSSAEKGSYGGVFEKWRDCWEENAVIDCFFHGAILSQKNIDDVVTNAKNYGITTYKILMTCKGDEAKMIGGDPVDDGFLWEAFKSVTRLGKAGKIMLHAENIEIINKILPAIRATKRQDLSAWAEARPGWCETLDVKRAISLAELTGCPIYFVHIHYPDSVQVIAEAQARGVNVVAETCPQYLILNTNNTKVPAPWARIAPPIRDEASNRALWKALRDGTITCLGSDHCSVTQAACQDLWTAPQGAPGVESFLPIMLGEGVSKRKITLQKLVEILCYNNAKTFGIYPQKGTIQVGSDADLVIIDMKKKGKISNSALHYKVSAYTNFDGWETTGWPVVTMVRGKVVVENDKMVAKPGWGRYIFRKIR